MNLRVSDTVIFSKIMDAKTKKSPAHRGAEDGLLLTIVIFYFYYFYHLAQYQGVCTNFGGALPCSFIRYAFNSLDLVYVILAFLVVAASLGLLGSLAGSIWDKLKRKK